jgi:hypothetical protein
MQMLSLASNELCQGLAPLCSLILHSASLTELDLSYNKIAGHSAAAVADAVGLSCRLKKVHTDTQAF